MPIVILLLTSHKYYTNYEILIRQALVMWIYTCPGFSFNLVTFREYNTFAL